MSRKKRRRRSAAGAATRKQPARPAQESPPPPRADEGKPLSDGRLMLLAMWFALLTGLLETLAMAVAIGLGVPVRLSPHFVWMIPVAHVLLFGVVAVLVLCLARVAPRLRTLPFAIGIFAGLSSLALLLVIETLHDAAVAVLALGIGVQAARLARGRLARGRFGRVLGRTMRGAVIAGAAIVLLLAAASIIRPRLAEARWLDALPAAAEGAPNVLLLILDTVRAQSMGLYGGDAATPELSAFARRGVVFDRAITPAPWTLPSHASMFTGRWPTELSTGWHSPMSGRYPTLAETLSSTGYVTSAFVANLIYATRADGLARGFVRYEDYPVSPGQMLVSTGFGRALSLSDPIRDLLGYHGLLNGKDAAAVTDAFLDWEAERADRPFFAFLNYYDAHEPYLPPDSLEGSPGWDRWWEGFAHHGGAAAGSNATYERKWEMTPAEARIHSAAYEAAIERLDGQLGRLLDELERRDLLDHTIIIVAGDHGEQLGEHGLFDHNNSLYMPALHVPLLIVAPGSTPANTRLSTVVSLRDLPVTVLDLVGLDRAAPALPGHSLADLWEEEQGQAEVSPAFAHLERGFVGRPSYPVGRGREIFSAVDERWHYILDTSGSEELYDLLRDPTETVNLADAAPAAGAAPAGGALVTMRERLRGFLAETRGWIWGVRPPPRRGS